MSWAGLISRSAPTSPSAATRSWSTARSPSAGLPGSLITRRSAIAQNRSHSPAAERGGSRAAVPPPSCYRPGDRPHLFYRLRAHRRRKGEPRGFTWADYRDLIITAHHHLAAPVVWVWDNLNVHLAPELADFAGSNPGDPVHYEFNLGKISTGRPLRGRPVAFP